MSTHTITKRVGLPITDLFLSIFGPVLVAATVVFIASILNIL